VQHTDIPPPQPATLGRHPVARKLLLISRPAKRRLSIVAKDGEILRLKNLGLVGNREIVKEDETEVTNRGSSCTCAITYIAGLVIIRDDRWLERKINHP